MMPVTTVTSLLDGTETLADERRRFLDMLALRPDSRLVESVGGSTGCPDESVDAVLCVDAIAHVRDRAAALADWARCVKTGGRILYTDPAIVAGLVTSEELAILGSMGLFVFAPQGENEFLIESAGLRLLRADDATDTIALAAAKGRDRFDGRERVLEVVYRLASERRLARIAFLAEKSR